MPINMIKGILTREEGDPVCSVCTSKMRFVAKTPDKIPDEEGLPWRNVDKTVFVCDSCYSKVEIETPRGIGI